MSTQVDHKETDTTYRRIQEKMDGDGGRVEQPSPKQRSSTICTMLGFVHDISIQPKLICPGHERLAAPRFIVKRGTVEYNHTRDLVTKCKSIPEWVVTYTSR